MTQKNPNNHHTGTPPARPRLPLAIFVITILLSVLAAGIYILFQGTDGGKEMGASEQPATAVSVKEGDGEAPTQPFVAVSLGVNSDGDVVVLSQEEREKKTTTVSLYFDYDCGACALFETQYAGAAIRDVITNSPDAAFDFHALNFLDRNSADDYSSRASNASLVVAGSDPDKWLSFHHALFEAHGGQVSNEGLVDIADSVGVSVDVDTLNEGNHVGWVTEATQSALTMIEGTPTVLIDGVIVEGDGMGDAEVLTRLISEAGAS